MKKLILALLTAMLLISGCSDKDNITMKVGDVPIYESFIDYLAKTFSTQAGGTVSDAAKKQARSVAEEMATYAAIGHIMKLDIAGDYNSYLKELEKQYGNLDKMMQDKNISQQLFEFISYAQVYRTKLIQLCESENDITRDKKIEYLYANYWRAKHLLLLTEGKNADEKNALKKKITSLYNRVKSGEDFDALIEEYNEDPGVKTNPDGYVFTNGEMVSEFQNAVASIEAWDFNLATTSYGYHIVQRLPIDETPELFEKFFAEKESEINAKLVDNIFNDFIDAKVSKFDILVLDYTGESEKEIIKKDKSDKKRLQP